VSSPGMDRVKKSIPGWPRTYFLFRQRRSQTSSDRLQALKVLMSFMVRCPGGTCAMGCRHFICVSSQTVMQAMVFADAPGPASEAAFCALAPAAVRIVAEQAITNNRVMWMDFATSASPVASIHCKEVERIPLCSNGIR